MTQKLRFCSGSSSRLQQNLTALLALNNDFLTLYQQMIKSAVSYRHSPKSFSKSSSVKSNSITPLGRPLVRYMKLSAKLAQNTLNIKHISALKLGKTLSIDFMDLGSSSIWLSLISICLARKTLDDLLWFVVNSKTGDNTIYPRSKGTVAEIDKSLNRSLKRQIEPSQPAIAEKQKKSVRFQSPPAPPPMPSLAAISIPKSLTPVSSMRKDFGNYLRRCIHRPEHEGVCVCIVENSGTCKSTLHPLSAASSLNAQLSQESTFPAHKLARNALLFSLAVVFLEIAHSAMMEKLYRPIDLTSGQGTPYTQSFVARRLAKSEYSVLGPRHHKIVGRLVECDFGCGDNLSNHRLQAVIHNKVICPLEQLE